MEKESYTYTLDANGGILTMAQADGSAWVYGHDNRYQVRSAALRNAVASAAVDMLLSLRSSALFAVSALKIRASGIHRRERKERRDTQR